MNPQNTLINAVNDLHTRWNSTNKKFLGERWRDIYKIDGKNRADYLDSAFTDELEERLSSDRGWSICQEVKLPGMPSIWSKYDISCYYNNEVIGLFELSVQDSNVAHALHNGEVKLLGICDGVSVNDAKQNLKDYRKLNDSVVSSVQKILSNVPVRGLFYTAGDGLYKKKNTIWFLTESKGRACFHSDLFDINSCESLECVFTVLRQKGLFTWYL